MSVVSMLAGVGLLSVCCLSSSVATTMMGGQKGPSAMGPSSTGPSTTGPAPPTSIKSLEILSNVPNSVTLTGVQANSPSAFNAKTKAVLVATIAIDSDSEGVIFESGEVDLELYCTHSMERSIVRLDKVMLPVEL